MKARFFAAKILTLGSCGGGGAALINCRRFGLFLGAAGVGFFAAVVFLAVVLRAVVFLDPVLLAVVFLAVAFFAVAFFAVLFLAVVLLVALVAAVGFAVLFFTGFLAPTFLSVAVVEDPTLTLAGRGAAGFAAARFLTVSVLDAVFVLVDFALDITFFAADFLAVVLRAVTFLPAAFLAVVFRAMVFRAVVFLTAAFFAVGLRAVVFLAVAFLAVVFLAVALRAVVFLAVVFRAGDFFAADFFFIVVVFFVGKGRTSYRSAVLQRSGHTVSRGIRQAAHYQGFVGELVAPSHCVSSRHRLLESTASASSIVPSVEFRPLGVAGILVWSGLCLEPHSNSTAMVLDSMLDRESSVQLFVEHQSRQLVRKGHGPESEDQLGLAPK